MRASTPPAGPGAFLTTGSGAAWWTWAGARLWADGGIRATSRFADLSWEERRKRLAEQEAAWLAAQWDPPAAGGRFEIRFATRPDADKVQAALLVRTLATTPDEAARRAAGLLSRSADGNPVLPSHVRSRPIDSEPELRAWLGYPGQARHLVEVRRQLLAGRVSRGGARLRYAVAHGFFDAGAAWDEWWRSFAALSFPAVLSIGYDPYDADSPAFRGALRQRTAELEELARPGAASPLNPHRVPPDAAAQAALPGYRRALARCTGRCFTVRLTLASARELPPALIESLVRTVSSATGAARPVPVAAAELEQAAAEFGALGAPWLPVSYQRGLPAELDPLDRLLHSLADAAEAAATLTLPVHWPGMPPVFDRDGGPLPEG